MNNGWLVNDFLTCISGTKTMWHDLLEWIPNLKDKTNGNFATLAYEIENLTEKTDFIIRNASWFRKINKNIPQVSYLQDILSGQLRDMQLNVCKSSITVFNSEFTKDKYPEIDGKIIPIGTDFNIFKPLDNKEELKKKYDIKNNTVLFIGSNNDIKQFNLVLDLILRKKFNFCLIMKDNFSKLQLPNVKIFNSVEQSKVVELINCCSVLICTSKIETLHLASIEAAACNIPIIGTKTGIYYSLKNDNWGHVSEEKDFEHYITKVLNNLNYYNPRDTFLKFGLDKETCKNKWLELINNL